MTQRLQAGTEDRRIWSLHHRTAAHRRLSELSITYVVDRAQSQFNEVVSGVWPRIPSNLKSLPEPGEISLKGAERPPDKKAYGSSTRRSRSEEKPTTRGERQMATHNT